MARFRARVIAASVATLVLLGPGALSAQAFDFTGAPGSYIEYSGTWKNYGTDDPGNVNVNPVTFGIVCDGDNCGIYGTFAASGFPEGPIVGSIKVTSGTQSLSLPAEGNPCGGGGRNPEELTLTATATHALVVIETLPYDCGGGNSSGGIHNEWEGDFSVGTPCVLDGHDCIASAGENPPGGGTEGQATGTSQLATGSWAAPSVLTALPTVAEAPTAPTQLGFATLLTIVLVLLVAFPTALLNSAIEHGSDRASSAIARFRRKPVQPSAVNASGWWKAALGVLFASFLSGFVDPQFGFNVGSVRLVASILISFVVDVVAGWWLLIWLVRRANPGISARFDFKPLSLLVVLVAVLFTRVTGFEPGIVFGLVAGVAFGTTLALAGQARAVLTSLGYGFALAIIGWVLYSVMTASVGANPNALQQFFLDTLASLTIAGVAALPIALVPLRGLAGHAVYAWKRWVWFTAYALGLFAFFFVLLPMPFSWAGVSLSLWTWIVIYIVYATAAIVLWLVLARPRIGPTVEDPSTAESPITHVDAE